MEGSGFHQQGIQQGENCEDQGHPDENGYDDSRDAPTWEQERRRSR